MARTPGHGGHPKQTPFSHELTLRGRGRGGGLLLVAVAQPAHPGRVAGGAGDAAGAAREAGGQLATREPAPRRLDARRRGRLGDVRLGEPRQLGRRRHGPARALGPLGAR